MEGKGRIRSYFLKVAALLSLYVSTICCERSERFHDIRISFDTSLPSVRSMLPDEEQVSDISLMIFDSKGYAEECIWLGYGQRTCNVQLIVDKEYTFCACANFGYQVYADHIDELEEIRFHMAYPDEYKEGIPMYAYERVTVREEETIHLSLERLMSKISLRMDRSRLREDVEMNIRSARIGNCPRSVKVFTESRVRDGDQCFPTGFILNDLQTATMNKTVSGGCSGEVSLYMFENMQGRPDTGFSSDKDKIFGEGDPRRELCSYIELEIEYLSSEKKSDSRGLIYRFYLGENLNSFDVERNCHYHITITPEGDGLGEDSWRVDKSGIDDIGPTRFAAYPASYIRGDIGDKVHLWCEFSPEHAPFDVGLSYLDDDKAEGIYDYEIDPDGHGVVLTLTGPGTGLIYMEAGEPVNNAALYIIEVNLPYSDTEQ